MFTIKIYDKGLIVYFLFNIFILRDQNISTIRKIKRQY